VTEAKRRLDFGNRAGEPAFPVVQGVTGLFRRLLWNPALAHRTHKDQAVGHPLVLDPPGLAGGVAEVSEVREKYLIYKSGALTRD
jgi:hypothetical protein